MARQRRNPSDQFAAALQQVGMPPWQVEGLLEDDAHYQRGEAAMVSKDVRTLTGAEAREITRFAHDYAHAFQ